MRKMLVVLAALALWGAAPCGSWAAEWKFEREIRIVCPWGAGGGADRTIRPMAELLKGILGQEVSVVNVTGRSGARGADYAYGQPADGYTFLLGTQSLFMLDMQAMTAMNFKTEFLPVARLVHAINVLAASKKAMDERGCRSFSELVRYLEKEPFDANVGMLAAAGLDGAAVEQTIEGIKGIDMVAVPYSSGARMNEALARGDVDLIIAGTEELEDQIAAGEILPLLALAEGRLKRWPEMECTVELGIPSTLGPARGIFAKRGTPQEAIDALAEAIEQASQTEEWQKFLVQGSYDERPAFAPSREYAEECEADYAALSEYLRAEGLLKVNYYRND